jgi:hypothetical protein
MALRKMTFKRIFTSGPSLTERRSGLNRRWIKAPYDGVERRSGRDQRDEEPPARQDALSPAERTEALEKLLLSTTVRMEAIARLLVAKGIMTRAELMAMLKTIHDEYQDNQLDEER